MGNFSNNSNSKSGVRKPSVTHTGVRSSAGKRVKAILAWIELYSYYVEQDIKYFELFINEKDKKKKKQYREISDYYNNLTDQFIHARKNEVI